VLALIDHELAVHQQMTNAGRVPDETSELFDGVSISAGMRELQILLTPAEYLQATDLGPTQSLALWFGGRISAI
jgi:prolyl-tRNA editing enzyme YbaK/EbsC (Cys-tRNA(Pro) deacylase)